MTYDANGNLFGNGPALTPWDARNHLSAISGAVSAGFVYGPFGRRMSKTIGASTTQFLYDGLNPVQELQSGAPTANMLTGLGIDEYFQRTDSNGAADFLSDGLGSTLSLTSATGALQTSYTYEPFGNTTASGAPSSNPFQFTGRENDSTGLYFYRARYYSPTFQRFVSQDPIGFARNDPNLYGYASQDPVGSKDVSGLASFGIRIFLGYGAGIDVGMNPDGSFLATVDFGVGFDVGAGYKPFGTSPGYTPNEPSYCSVGTFGQAGVGFGGADIGVGAETGTDFGPGGASPYYGSGLYGEATPPVGGGVELGGSAGGRIGIGLN